jgi:hypothetical protein
MHAIARRSIPPVSEAGLSTMANSGLRAIDETQEARDLNLQVWYEEDSMCLDGSIFTAKDCASVHDSPTSAASN